MDTPNSRKSLVDETYEALIDLICSGEILPGTRLNQDEIAVRFNVSRQPVISALAILKTNGFVKDNGRRGLVVTSIEPDQFQSICEFRAVVEPLAVSLAASQIRPDWEKSSETILTAGAEALERGDSRALLQADMDFHEMVYRWSGNPIIENSMRANWPHIWRAMNEELRNPSAAVPSWKEHVEIVRHLLSGDGKEAAKVMKKHINRAGKRTMKVLQSNQIANGRS